MKRTFIFIFAIVLVGLLFTSCTVTFKAESPSPTAKQAVSPLKPSETPNITETSESTPASKTSSLKEDDALTPDKVVEKMFQAVYDGDGKSFLECWDTGARTYEIAKRMDERGELKSPDMIYRAMGFDVAIDKVEMLSVELDESDEDTAKVTAELEVWSGIRSMKGPLELKLIKKDGKWVITD